MAIYTKNQLLAWDLALALDDKKHFGFYASLAKKYPEWRLRQVMKDVLMSKNISKVKNKGAYFIKSFFNPVEKKL